MWGPQVINELSTTSVVYELYCDIIKIHKNHKCPGNNFKLLQDKMLLQCPANIFKTFSSFTTATVLFFMPGETQNQDIFTLSNENNILHHNNSVSLILSLSIEIITAC